FAVVRPAMQWFPPTLPWHPENYNPQMPEVTGWSPVATIPSCLIVPTGRTRRDPDHAVTGLRRGVAESPSADNARGCSARRVSNFTWEFEFLNSHRGPELDAGCAHSDVDQRQTGSMLHSMRRSGTNQMSATST